MGHADFRVDGRIFAALGYPDPCWAAVKLSAAEQAAFMAMQPRVFTPAKGAWGRAGSTMVLLGEARKAAVQAALAAAWEGITSKASTKRRRTGGRRGPER